MKIALIGQKTMPFIGGKGGGVEKHVEELATRLVARGHEVTAYSRDYLVEDKIKEFKGVKIIYTPSIPTKNLDTISHVFFSTIHALFQDFDVIHYHGVGPSTLAWIPRVFKPRAKVVVTFHSIDRFHKKWGAFARWYLGLGEWTAVHFPHVCIAVSRSIQEYCRHNYNKELIYIPNGTDLRKTSEAHDNRIRRFGLAKDNYILTVARLIKHKGIHYLIEAYKKMERTHGTDPSKWPGGQVRKLAIVGAPSYTDDYLDYLKKLAAGSPNIIFVGFQQGETLAQLFANAYLYVHPSEAEGLSITILEAMSYGTCVLVSNIPENLESIDHAGFIFETKNVNDLYEMMVYLLDFPESVKRHGEKGLAFIKKNFNWEDIVTDIEKTYLK
ncbi:MAG: glycosyltransferase family 4 protein [Patescibacteria group bacterium]|nr:glycosyltransferase family 4 protein [Patescibacteria group bacterium]